MRVADGSTYTLAETGLNFDTSTDPITLNTGGSENPVDPATVSTVVEWWPIPTENTDHPIITSYFTYVLYSELLAVVISSIYSTTYTAFITVEMNITFPSW